MKQLTQVKLEASKKDSTDLKENYWDQVVHEILGEVVGEVLPACGNRAGGAPEAISFDHQGRRFFPIEAGHLQQTSSDQFQRAVCSATAQKAVGKDLGLVVDRGIDLLYTKKDSMVDNKQLSKTYANFNHEQIQDVRVHFPATIL